MKKIYLLFVAAAIAACSAEPIQNDLTTLDSAVTGKIKATVQDAGESFVIPETICAGEEAAFIFNFNDKPGKISLKVQLEGDDPATEEIEEWYNIFNEQFDGGGPENFYYTFENSGDHQLRYQIGGGGFTMISVYVENCGCDERFTNVDNGDMTYTFTYIPENDMVDAELVFTFPQGTPVSGLEGWHNNGKAQTWHLTESLNACQTYIWTVGLKANCPGNTTKNNVWTDFQINDHSKKNNGEDKFIQLCS